MDTIPKVNESWINNHLILVIILTLIVIGFISGILIYRLLSESNKTNATFSQGKNNSAAGPAGIWKIKSAYQFNDISSNFDEIPINFDFYMEYTEDGKWCSQWEEGYTKCVNYDTYSINEDTINQHKEGLVGPEWHYKWKIINGDLLELTSEVFDNETNSWTPWLRYDLKKVDSYPELS